MKFWIVLAVGLSLPFTLFSIAGDPNKAKCRKALTQGAEIKLLRSYSSDETEFLDLKNYLPLVTTSQLNSLADQILGDTDLRKRERLLIALIRLARDPSKPKSGEDIRFLFSNTIRWVEQDYSNIDVVNDAFLAYDFDNLLGTYDENAHPKIFSEVLKPPARRYGRRDIFPDLEIITQLDHITIINESNGALEIQLIDPSVRNRLQNPNDPLVIAILEDLPYFQQLPNRRDLVLFKRPGSDGNDVWGKKPFTND